MEDIERIRERRENIEGIEPLITSLRTISAGGWHQALRRQRGSEGYSRYLGEVLAATLPHLSQRELGRLGILADESAPDRALMLVISSETGLAGGYNDSVFRGAEQIIDRQRMQSSEVLIATLGARATAYFRQQERELVASFSLPITRVAPLELVVEIARDLRELLDNDETDAIYVIYSPYKPGVTVPPVVERWLPVDRSLLPSESVAWPEPFIETEPRDLFRRALREWILARLYSFVTEAAASEHAARFRAMEAASNNLQRMIEELTLQYHSARQHAITMEMLDLIGGSEILAGPHGSV